MRSWLFVTAFAGTLIVAALLIPEARARAAGAGIPVAQAGRRAVDPAKEKRLEWFRAAKYGLFIHWGLYAVPAGEWKGQRSLGLV